MHYFPRHRAFSLIEVLVAIAILGVMVAATGALASGLPLSRTTGEQSLALSIAENELETLRANGYDALPASGPFSDSRMSALTSGAGTLAVSAYDAKTDQVVVSVSWREESGAARSVALTALITETGGLP